MVWLKPEDVAERLGVARRTAISLMNQMPHSVISGTYRKRVRVSEEALNTWILQRSVGVKPVVSIHNTGSKKRLQRR